MSAGVELDDDEQLFVDHSADATGPSDSLLGLSPEASLGCAAEWRPYHQYNVRGPTDSSTAEVDARPNDDHARSDLDPVYDAEISARAALDHKSKQSRFNQVAAPPAPAASPPPPSPSQWPSHEADATRSLLTRFDDAASAVDGTSPIPMSNVSMSLAHSPIPQASPVAAVERSPSPPPGSAFGETLAALQRDLAKVRGGDGGIATVPTVLRNGNQLKLELPKGLPRQSPAARIHALRNPEEVSASPPSTAAAAQGDGVGESLLKQRSEDELDRRKRVLLRRKARLAAMLQEHHGIALQRHKLRMARRHIPTPTAYTTSGY